MSRTKDYWADSSNLSSIWGLFLKELPAALRGAFDWRTLLPLVFAVGGAMSLIGRAFGITLAAPVGEALLSYEALRDGIFSPLAVLFSYLGLVIPWWSKDAFFVYLRISQAMWRTIASFRPKPKTEADERDKVEKPAEGEKLGDPPWLLLRILWACAVWPYHFLMFWLGRRNPVFTYRKLSPLMEIYVASGGSWARDAFYGRAAAHFIASSVAVLGSAAVMFMVNAVAKAMWV